MSEAMNGVVVNDACASDAMRQKKSRPMFAVRHADDASISVIYESGLVAQIAYGDFLNLGDEERFEIEEALARAQTWVMFNEHR